MIEKALSSMMELLNSKKSLPKIEKFIVYRNSKNLITEIVAH